MVSTVMVVGVMPTSVLCRGVLVQSVDAEVAPEPDDEAAVVADVAPADVLPPLLREQPLATTIPANSTDAQIDLLT
jgi:hypothetical protein